jgi:hypothetical protein
MRGSESWQKDVAPNFSRAIADFPQCVGEGVSQKRHWHHI